MSAAAAMDATGATGGRPSYTERADSPPIDRERGDSPPRLLDGPTPASRLPTAHSSRATLPRRGSTKLPAPGARQLQPPSAASAPRRAQDEAARRVMVLKRVLGSGSGRASPTRGRSAATRPPTAAAYGAANGRPPDSAARRFPLPSRSDLASAAPLERKLKMLQMMEGKPARSRPHTSSKSFRVAIDGGGVATQSATLPSQGETHNSYVRPKTGKPVALEGGEGPTRGLKTAQDNETMMRPASEGSHALASGLRASKEKIVVKEPFMSERRPTTTQGNRVTFDSVPRLADAGRSRENGHALKEGKELNGGGRVTEETEKLSERPHVTKDRTSSSKMRLSSSKASNKQFKASAGGHSKQRPFGSHLISTPSTEVPVVRSQSSKPRPVNPRDYLSSLEVMALNSIERLPATDGSTVTSVRFDKVATTTSTLPTPLTGPVSTPYKPPSLPRPITSSRKPREPPFNPYLKAARVREPPPPPDEEFYTTRPMSPHRAYRLADYVRPAAMRTRPQEQRDNFDQRVRGLFLPSLFQSSENIRFEDDDLDGMEGEDVDDDVALGKVIMPSAAQIRRRNAERGRVGGRTWGQGPSTGYAAYASGAGDADADGSGMGSRRFTSRSARTRARQLLRSPRKKTQILYPMATMDTGGLDPCPPDLDPVYVRWLTACQWALRKGRMACRATGEEEGAWEMDDVGRIRKDVVNHLRVQRVLDMDPVMREDKEMDALDRHRYKLLNTCRVETYARGKVLLNEGDRATHLFVITLGECLLEVRPGHPTSSTSIRLRSGGVLGEFGSFNMSEVRSCRATALMRTEVLRIEKLDYVNIAREARTMDTYIAEFFGTVPPLLNCKEQLPVQLSQRSVVRHYDVETLLLKAGEVNPNNYFITIGKVRGIMASALHLVTFIKSDLGAIPGTSRHRYSLLPYTEARRAAMRPTDEIVRELAGVADFGPGQYFPPLTPSRVVTEQAELRNAATSGARHLGPASSKTRPASARGASAGSTRPGSGSITGGGGGTHFDPESVPPSPFHFVVIEKLECVVIARQDLFELVPADLYRRLCDSCMGVTTVSAGEVEERYLSSQGWRGAVDWDNKAVKELMNPDAFKDGSWANPVIKGKEVDVGPVLRTKEGV
ncbi:hypothetical protein HK101_011595 [Irineochytrium annulatum]|nr:hypothetical protein HK101_011595 [Irineochytrium annulatum]